MTPAFLSDFGHAGAWLLEAALRGLILAIAVGGSMAVVRLRNPHIQLVAWRAVLLGALAMPLLMPLVVVTMPLAELPVAELAGAPRDIAAALETRISSAGLDVASNFDSVDLSNDRALVDWRVVAIAVYGAVAGALLLRLALGAALSWRIRGAAQPVRTAWTKGLDVRVSAVIRAPVTVWSTILVPDDHVGWSAEKRRAVILHERAHIARGDFYVQICAALYRALFWFSPLAWWLHDNLGELAEVVSDAEAVADVVQRPAYAAILLEFAATPRTRFSAVAMARPHTVRRRIERLLTDNTPLARITGRRQLQITLAIVFLTLATAVSAARAPAIASLSPTSPALSTQAADVPQLLIPPPTAGKPESSVPDHRPPAVAAPDGFAPPVSLDRGFDDQMRAVRGPSDQRLRARLERSAERMRARLERDAKRDAKRDATQRDVDSGMAIGASAALEPSPNIPTTTETRIVPQFDSISFAPGLGTLTVAIGETQSLELEGDAETLRDVRSEVRDGTLIVGDVRRSWHQSGEGRLTAHVIVTSLKSIRFSGAGHLQLAALNGGETAVKFSGSGTIDASGKLDRLALTISGSGRADLADLIVADAKIDISGSGNATLQPRRNLDVEISGSGQVRYIGDPAHITTSISGSGSVRPREGA